MRFMDSVNKSYIPPRNSVEQNWYVVDATEQRLGRLASEIANILRGKNKPEYTPHLDTGGFVIVVNAEKIKVTGKKRHQKLYHRHSGRPGGKKTETFAKLQARLPERIIEHAVKGMLPKNSLGRRLFTKLKVYAGPNHPHAAQKPQIIKIDTVPTKGGLKINKTEPILRFNQPEKELGNHQMAVIKKPYRNGLRALAFHSQLLDFPIAPTSEISTTLIQKAQNSDQQDKVELAYSYLKQVWNNSTTDEVNNTFVASSVEEALDFQVESVETLPFLETTIVRFRQCYHKIPLYGSFATVELDQNQDLLAINSAITEHLIVNSVATIEREQVLQLVKQLAGYGELSENFNVELELYCYFDTEKKRWRLVYIAQDVLKIDTDETQDQYAATPEVVDYVIDAHDGTYITEIARTQ